MFKISVFFASLLMLFMNFANAEEIYAIKISKDYESNSIAAANKYENKDIEIAGSVSSIANDISNNPVVQLYGRDNFNSVDMMVSKDDPFLLKISKYDFVHATCNTPSYTLGDVVLQNCKISGFEKPKNVKG